MEEISSWWWLFGAITLVGLAGLAGALTSYCPDNSQGKHLAGIVLSAVCLTSFIGMLASDIRPGVIVILVGLIMALVYVAAWAIRLSYSKRKYHRLG